MSQNHFLYKDKFVAMVNSGARYREIHKMMALTKNDITLLYNMFRKEIDFSLNVILSKVYPAYPNRDIKNKKVELKLGVAQADRKEWLETFLWLADHNKPARDFRIKLGLRRPGLSRVIKNITAMRQELKDICNPPPPPPRPPKRIKYTNLFPFKGSGKGYSQKYPPILIWTPGKTGQSMAQNILIAAECLNAMSIHTLNVETRQDGMPAPGHEKRRVRRNSLLQYFSTHNDIKIITIVRDVMRRNISSLFYNYYYKRNYNYFINTFNHTWYLDWFDNEIKKHTGFDVYRHEFNKSKGWSHFRYGKFSIIILRQENLYKGIKDSCKSVWNISIGKNIRVNTQDDKVVYHKFCKNQKFSKDFLMNLYRHKHMKHFYSLSDIQKFVSYCKK